mmetsp:Transcript_82350/g.229198  ORF Transcript_82350/g.229198 Transcript_82350/m.229198 type:complete len:305 (+) Transcript_82350:570-1484(+)
MWAIRRSKAGSSTRPAFAVMSSSSASWMRYSTAPTIVSSTIQASPAPGWAHGDDVNAASAGAPWQPRQPAPWAQVSCPRLKKHVAGVRGAAPPLATRSCCGVRTPQPTSSRSGGQDADRRMAAKPGANCLSKAQLGTCISAEGAPGRPKNSRMGPRRYASFSKRSELCSMSGGATRRFREVQASKSCCPWRWGIVLSWRPWTIRHGDRTCEMRSPLGNRSRTRPAAAPMYSRQSSRTERKGQMRTRPAKRCFTDSATAGPVPMERPMRMMDDQGQRNTSWANRSATRALSVAPCSSHCPPGEMP